MKKKEKSQLIKKVSLLNDSRKAGWILRIRLSSGINPRLPNPIFNPILHFFFFFFQWILELRGKFWEFGPQVANTVSSHMLSSHQFSIWLVNFRKKKEVNSEHSCYKWIIPEVPICHLYPDFPFFSTNSRKTGWNLRIYPPNGIDPKLPYPIFYPIFHFFQRILGKRD